MAALVSEQYTLYQRVLHMKLGQNRVAAPFGYLVDESEHASQVIFDRKAPKPDQFF